MTMVVETISFTAIIIYIIYVFVVDVLTLKDVLSETRYVSDWKTLGVCLGIPFHEIRLIEAKHGSGNISHCKMELFDVWLNSDPNASWFGLGQALLDTPDRNIGVKILQTHSLPLLSRGGGKLDGWG